MLQPVTGIAPNFRAINEQRFLTLASFNELRFLKALISPSPVIGDN